MAYHLVIMAGGIGSRFWPMSTPQCPKQFLDITGCGKTMIQQTFERYDNIIDIANLWVVTSKDYKDFVLGQLQGINPQHVLLEPCLRNTAPCIAYVSWKIKKEDPDAVMVVAPSDHLVLKKNAFKNYITKGLKYVESWEAILTMGMKPSEPNTGYGYIEQGDEFFKGEGIYNLKSFREKPDLKTAISYLEQGGFTWNSGMFLWHVDVIIEELRQYAPEIAEIMDQLQPSLLTEKEQDEVDKLFPLCPKISIDYAVMEKTHKACVMPAEYGWSDLGTWGSLHALTQHDDNNNSVIGNNIKMIESVGCMVRMPKDKNVVIQGLKDFIIAENDNTLLICQLSEEQRIKEWHN
jgi:mannose-1-phosphate guanylyltransferase